MQKNVQILRLCTVLTTNSRLKQKQILLRPAQVAQAAIKVINQLLNCNVGRKQSVCIARVATSPTPASLSAFALSRKNKASINSGNIQDKGIKIIQPPVARNIDRGWENGKDLRVG
ncbi:hypothetical protein HUJ04_002211 [Dendroctonus ponderosae]|nr:hypothetical protein HUJ04_002211 [Dendroctonus ponderosae]KAH1017966.1 hypothetical protein HUJ05_008540 [Dendroctonus ponderosae]